MLTGLLRAHAHAHPDRTAVVAGPGRVTYRELDDRVTGTARLLHEHGIGPGRLVGVYLDRTPDAVVAMLAALRAGAAYTVVDPTEPVGESAARLAAADPDVVLAAPCHAGEFTGLGLPVAQPQTGPHPQTGPAPEATAGEHDPAYVLYTSGSTGVPKGVVVSHANIRHYTESLLDRLAITEPLAYAHVTTLAADLGNTCVFLALWTGGTLHLVDDATRRDPQALRRYLRAERIDVLKTTPSHWAAVLPGFDDDAQAGPALRMLVLGGELLSLPLARRVLASGTARTLVNHYGPTETTVGVACHVLDSPAHVDGLGDAASVPIGRPLGANRLFVRTADGRFRERDATGELYVAGPSVALGYRGDDAATAAAFTRDLEQAHPGAGRAYRTGDRVRISADGVLEFLGRGDRQVKIKGYRVELGHVENGLRRLPAVADAVVVHRADRRPALVAAVVTDSRRHGPRPDVHRQLRQVLPPYLVPDRIEFFDAFPRNDNGKTDHGTLRELIETRLARGAAPPAAPPADPVLADVRAAWQRALGHQAFGADDDFTAAGGNSIDAITVIGNLQALGYHVSAAAFLAAPTPAALAARLRAAAHRDAPGPARPPAADDGTALSPAQSWFFAQDFAQPDRWNQALLLDIDAGVRVPELAAAVRDVLTMHPMLRTAFRPHGPGGRARRREVRPPQDVFTSTALPAGEEAAAGHIEQIAGDRQAELSIADGTVFKAHLFRSDTQAHLLLLCHHLSVDAVSWRILVDDLSRCYDERSRGGEPRLRQSAPGFGAWATHLRDNADRLRPDLAYWDGLDRLPAYPATAADGDNLEQDAQAVWFALSPAETDAMTGTAANWAGGAAPHVMLLGALAHALADLHGTDEVVLDVESHGRAALDETIDIARTVGWFTSTFPVRLAVTAGDLAATTKSAAAALDGVPRLGVAYGLHGLPRRTDVCFNHLGSLPLPHTDDLRPVVSRHAVGPVRGPGNDRVHGLKVTARISDGRLVVDLSFSARRHDPERMRALARAMRACLLDACGLPDSAAPLVTERGSSTGLLVQVPSALLGEPPAATVRAYRRVLLTGATGFIGAHLLHLLLTRTEARITCLVREKAGTTPLQRLRDAYAWHIPGEGLDRYAGRIEVLAADLSEPDLGLAPAEHARLSRDVEAIYHLAADTRLFGERDTFAAHNVGSVRALVRLAATGRPKDLHHVSTLAVCGSGPDGDPAGFCEDSLDIGQRFLNEYERSKYDAERVVRDFAAQGGAGFVYRTGNVTGHSVTGRFQRNGGDSRLVQLLRACVRLGRVPRLGPQTLALSPVDVVAAGILEISRCARIPGGTFHVDTAHHVRYTDVFAALRDLGCELDEDDAPGFADLFEPHLSGGDPAVLLAHFWAGRPERNVRYDHSRTRRTLAALGVEFPVLTRDWLVRHLDGLQRQGELVPPARTGAAHG
ncbi:non-ribosomal peptide synthetase [Catellatospora bangladeshensis]|uniref:Carrier domain-containing protein n=1 Tax=Catellatospora bangladeshensis TaxID=310355 RepID=A0A8J3JWG2_9ACTN|nr:non-ribosomal peptide synthetase [Catellatospora bangladeshensis]GIF84339.1 hypothetical protein Cba03nite_56880 [Catellatospora bangladeshensis]